MSLHIGMDKHGVRWKDRGNCWLSGRQNPVSEHCRRKRKDAFRKNLDSDFDGDDAKELLFAVYIA